ncbi:hypothetical protein [Nostoc parmelioides]|uniref:Fibronectin type-III domain-containing protein n=1 Tax=Nostoc parmelioides FACHB-3921 TaxID=2692909 RepID=A0ABR8BQB6_9NOSO|nr:hypothetical protein [Nostoc parmelioides]MBD2255814.1 hypothetical protein [Nostoc parmelioides FACHB-3921]
MNPGWGQPRAKLDSKKDSACKPIAKVISGDSRYQPSTKLCSEDRVVAVNGGTVKILCYPRGKIIDIPSDIVGKQCLPLKVNEGRGCNVLQRRSCVIPKGPEEENKPTKVIPYGVVINQERPTISWSKVKGATDYVVRMQGNGGINWEATVKGESLTYPSQEAVLKTGQAYTLDIVAMRGDEVIDGSSSLLLLLPTDKTQELENTINVLNHLQQPLDELAIDKDAVYESYNLVNESIKVLDARAVSGSTNPTIYRLLGDRYLIANFPQQANEAYLTAKKLAQQVNNTVEMALAEAGSKMAAWTKDRNNSRDN